MTTKEQKQIAQLLLELANVTKGTKPNAAEIAARARVLADLPFDRVAVAIRVGMNEFEFFPSAAEVRRICEAVEGGAESAWSKVCGLVRSRGWPNPPTSSDLDAKEMAAVEASGGWRALCETRTEELPARAGRFVKSWILYRRQQEAEVAHREMHALIERVSGGLAFPKPEEQN